MTRATRSGAILIALVALSQMAFAEQAAAPFKAAHLQILDKVTARTATLEVKPLLPAAYGTIDISVKQCWRAPDDARPEQAALLEIRERKAQLGDSKLLFSGWMFASAPALSALEHPVYDVSLLRCE